MYGGFTQTMNTKTKQNNFVNILDVKYLYIIFARENLEVIYPNVNSAISGLYDQGDVYLHFCFFLLFDSGFKR